MKGYKVFNPNWTCREKQYTCPGTFEQEGKLVLCKNGIHFCKKLIDCFIYYVFSPKNKVAEIEAIGEIIEDESTGKCCTSKIKIIRELTWYEVLNLVNVGTDNTGLGNSGDYNSGDCNTGDYNSGNYNSGNYNTGNYNTGNCNSGKHNTGHRNIGNYNSGRNNVGDFNSGDFNFGDYNTGDYNTSDYNTGDYNTGVCNTGDYNTSDYNTGDYNTGVCNTGDYNTGVCNTGDYNIGNYNTGDYNSGKCNSGNRNSGNYNTGDYNFGSHNTGCFNLKENKLYFFDKPSNWTYKDWVKSKAKKILNKIEPKPLSWTVKYNEYNITEEEKEKHPEYKTRINGFLEHVEEEKLYSLRQKRWKNLSEEEKKTVLSLPNFDAKIFKKITGIDVTIEK